VLSGLVLGLVARLCVIGCRVVRVVVGCCVEWSCVVGCVIRIFVVAVSSFRVRRHAVLSVRGGEWRGAASGSGFVGLLGWCRKVPVGIEPDIAVVSSVGRLSAVSSTSLEVDCVMGCVSGWVGAMAGGSPPGGFSVVSGFMIIVIVVDSVGGSIWESSSASPAASVVNCGSGGAW